MSAPTHRSRVPAGVRTGGQYATQAHAEADADLSTPRFDFVGRDAEGVNILREDTVMKAGGGWSATRWRVVDTAGDRTLVASTTNEKVRRRVDLSDYTIVRPHPDFPTPEGCAAHLDNEPQIEALRDAWADRDPAYAAALQAVIDDLPMRAVGQQYRDQMIAQVAPEHRRTVATCGAVALYFSLRNGMDHDDALTAATGHSNLPARPPNAEALRSMGDDEFRVHRLVWSIRNHPDAYELVKQVEAERNAR